MLKVFVSYKFIQLCEIQISLKFIRIFLRCKSSEDRELKSHNRYLLLIAAAPSDRKKLSVYKCMPDFSSP
jgi:hypothetical protein